MPAPGDQHHSWQNPYEDQKTRINMWTAQEIATIASKLDKQLGPEYISARAGPGGQRVHYLTAEKCITLANEVFGFNGWSSSIQNIQVDFADENPQNGRVSIGLSVIVRITLRDGTYHEDIGYGSIDNAKSKAMAFEKAKKEGTTDGLKRALRSFGNVLGNCIYDQDYVKQVVKHKAQPVKKFDPNNLHRHSDFVAEKDIKQEPVAKTTGPAPAAAAPAAALPQSKIDPSESFEDFLGELDEADFCVPEDGHPDEIVLPGPANVPETQMKAPPTTTTTNQPPNRPPQTPNQMQSRPGNQPQQNRPQPPPPPQNNRPTPNQQPAGPPANVPGSVGFFSAKAVSKNPESSMQGVPQGQQMFNPKLESPSIRKTPGIDHNSSKPVSKSGQHVAPSNSQAQTSNSGGFTPVRPSMGSSQGSRGGNMINPALEGARRIGAPGGPGSPLGNRNSFRQPTMKRPPPGDNGSRPVLADTTNTVGNDAVAADGMDAKRQKTT